MLSFAAFSMSVSLLAYFYIFWNLRRFLGGGWWQLPVLAFMALMLGAFVLRRRFPGNAQAETLLQISYYWMGFALIALSWLLAADIARLLARLLDMLGGWDISRLLAAKKTAPFIFLWCLALFGYAVYTAQNVQLRNVEIKTGKLPEGVERLRIAVLTDIHIDQFASAGRIEKIVRLTNGCRPDIIVSLGDLVDTNMSSKNGEKRLLRQLQAPLGKFAVLGNHEFYRGPEQSVKFTAGAGFKLLRGEAEEAGGIDIVGVDDPMFEGRASIRNSLKRADPGKFILLLSHRPETPENALGMFDLQLSGHTHAGQIWPAVFLTRLMHGHWQGLSELTPGKKPRERRSLLYLSNGTGYWGPPVRLWASPEITVIDLIAE